ncbi:MAG: hypothetical protein Tsb0034_00860 [Ekhidna sp.]
MSMAQRSLVMPGYLTELKALIACQAYNFWQKGETEPYVSHLNIYSSLHRALKYLDWDSSRNMAYNQVGYHGDRVTTIQLGREPGTYYTASADGSILEWRIDKPKAIPEVVYKSSNIIRSLDISTDGSLLLAAFYQTGLALIPIDNISNQDITVLEDPEPVQTAVFIPGENRYLSVTKQGDLKIKGFNQDTEKVGKTNLKVNELAVDKNDGTIYAGTAEGTLEAWEKPYEIDSEEMDGIIKEMESQSYFGYELGTFAINCMDISSDGTHLAIGRERGDVILWNLRNKNIIRVISSHQSAITDIDFSPDGKLLLTTSRDKTARLWDLSDSRKLPVILDDHEDWVYAGSFDATGTKVLTGSGDQFIRSWYIDPGEMASKICTLLSRNMTEEEWQEFVGKGVPYEKTCK